MCYHVLPGAVSLALDNNVSKGSPADTMDIGAQGSTNTIGSHDSSDPAADGHDTPAPPAGKASVTSPSSAVENMVNVHASRRENMQADARGSMGGSRQPAQVAGESRMLYEMGDVRHGTQSAQLVSNGWAGRADVFGGGGGGSFCRACNDWNRGGGGPGGGGGGSCGGCGSGSGSMDMSST